MDLKIRLVVTLILLAGAVSLVLVGGIVGAKPEQGSRVGLWAAALVTLLFLLPTWLA